MAKAYINAANQGVYEVDHINRVFDIPEHDASAKGLKLGGTLVTATAAELNIMDGVTATAAELNAIDVSVVGGVRKLAKVSLTAATHGTGSEVNTSLVMPTRCIIHDVYLRVTAAEVTGATKTLTVGTNVAGSNDADGLAVSLDVSATGIKQPRPTITTGLNESYLASTVGRRGELLATIVAGSDNAGDVGTYIEFDDIETAATTISVTSGSAFTEFAGTLYVAYTELE